MSTSLYDETDFSFPDFFHFPWPLWNSLTFPGIPCFPGEWLPQRYSPAVVSKFPGSAVWRARCSCLVEVAVALMQSVLLSRCHLQTLGRRRPQNYHQRLMMALVMAARQHVNWPPHQEAVLQHRPNTRYYYYYLFIMLQCFQCFDAVGSAAGTAS